MLLKMKNDLLREYQTHARWEGSHTVFIEIGKDKVYDKNSDVDIPLKLIQFQDGHTVFAAIPELMDFMKRYADLYSDNLFSRTAFEHLFEFVAGRVKQHQQRPYTNDGELEKHMIYYALDNSGDIDISKIQKSTIQFKSDTNYQNITSSYTQLSEGSVYYGTLLKNHIVSIVGTNTPVLKSPDAGVVDIGVETHIDYRHKGYASSNITAMSEYLLKNGYVVKYGCNNKNIGSNRAAVSSGFKEVAKEKTVWCVGE